MTPKNEGKTGWQADLDEFFAGIERENEVFSQNALRKSKFYAETARPALDAVRDALALHGRECETGVDGDRVYIIVRKDADTVEFQYAVVAEVTVEKVAPFAHCWFDEAAPDDESEMDESGETDGKSDDEDDSSDDENDDSDDDSGEESSDGDEDKKDEKDEKPKRVKTVEPLAGWENGRDLESVSREEIIGDFLAHYKEAVNRSRLKMHDAEKTKDFGTTDKHR